MSLTGFQRRRRTIAAQKAEQEENILGDGQTGTNGQIGGQDGNDQKQDDQSQGDTHKELTDDAIDAMELEELRAELDKREVSYVHNAGVDNLKGKLKDAIAGA